MPLGIDQNVVTLVWSPLSGGWLSGKWRKGAETTETHRSTMMGGARSDRYDLSDPVYQRKLDAADALAVLAEKNDVSLVQLAIAFTIRHPGVTSAIIGPRTMDHLESQLGAADVTLDAAILDRIDEIVAPGVNVNPTDSGWQNPDLEPSARRR